MRTALGRSVSFEVFPAGGGHQGLLTGPHPGGRDPPDILQMEVPGDLVSELLGSQPHAGQAGPQRALEGWERVVLPPFSGRIGSFLEGSLSLETM